MKTSAIARILPVAAIAFAVLWAGCESSPVPLSDPPSVPIDPALTGTWEIATDDGSAGDQAEVFAFNEHEYLVEYREASTNEDGSVSYDEMQRVRMFMTDVDGRTFVNVRCIGCDDDEDGWLFMELRTPRPGLARLSVVSDDVYSGLEDDVTPEAVLARLRQILTQPDALGDTAEFRRIAD